MQSTTVSSCVETASLGEEDSIRDPKGGNSHWLKDYKYKMTLASPRLSIPNSKNYIDLKQNRGESIGDSKDLLPSRCSLAAAAAAATAAAAAASSRSSCLLLP